MDVIQKNDSIILKGTNFKSKPVFASFRYSKFDALIRNLMLKYGETITDSQPMKGKEYFCWEDGGTRKSRPVPIPLQSYLLPFYYSMLLVVGSDDSDTLVLTSPIAENVRKLLGFYNWSKKDEEYQHMLLCMGYYTGFIPLTYNCTLTKLRKDWHKTVHLRKRDKVELYVVPKPLEYFPMLFVNCSMDNIRNLYDNITALMISKNDPMYYYPFNFTCTIFRPILFNIFETHIEYKQRLPGIDVTDEEFALRRSEWLFRDSRYMVSDCRCRSNTAVLPRNRPGNVSSWGQIEQLFCNYGYNGWSNELPRYTAYHSTCQECCNKITT